MKKKKTKRGGGVKFKKRKAGPTPKWLRDDAAVVYKPRQRHGVAAVMVPAPIDEDAGSLIDRLTRVASKQGRPIIVEAQELGSLLTIVDSARESREDAERERAESRVIMEQIAAVLQRLGFKRGDE